MRRTKERQQLVLDAVLPKAGVITQISKATGVSRQAIYDWLKNDKDFEREFKERAKELAVFSASLLLQNALNGNIRALVSVYDRNIMWLEHDEVSLEVSKKLEELNARHAY